MNKTKLVHQSTIWCMCVRACVYALFAIVSRIIWKYRHVSISRWKCVPISLFSSLPYVLSHILAYRRVKIQFYINMLLQTRTHTSLWLRNGISHGFALFLAVFAVAKECGCIWCHFRTILMPKSFNRTASSPMNMRLQISPLIFQFFRPFMVSVGQCQIFQRVPTMEWG